MKKIKLFPKIFILAFSILSILTLFIHLIVYTFDSLYSISKNIYQEYNG